MRHYFSTLPPVIRERLAWIAVLTAVALATWMSSLLSAITLDLPIFSLHAGLTLGLAIRFGLAFAVSGALGSALCLLLMGSGFQASFAAFAGLALGALSTACLFANLQPKLKTEISKRFILMGLICFVFAPIVASTQFWKLQPVLGGYQNHLVGLLAQSAFEALSALLFAPVVLTWLPKIKGEGQPKTIGQGLSRTVVALIALCLVVAHSLGQEKAFVLGQMMLALALVMSLVPAFAGSKRQSAATIALVSTVFVVEQALYAQAGASILQLNAYQRVSLTSALMFVGAILGHLLNGLSTQTAVVQKALEEQILRNTFSGLLNRRYFFKVLHQITAPDHKQAEFLGEIAIPDLNHWAEFSGREAAHQFDARIVERIDFALKDYAHLVAHAVLGSYFIQLKSTADPLAVIDAIESATREACALHGIKGMQLRPQVALLRVPRDVRATPEDILATLANALRRSEQSLKRWSMISLQSDVLQKQREASREDEIIVESLSSSLVRVFTQTILPVQGQCNTGLHFEVLARLQNLHGGFVSPGRFLPVYANCGLLPQFDRQVLHTLFEAFELEPSLVKKISGCSINLTGPTLSDPDLIAFIEAQFAGALIQPKQIVFEITESDKITNPMQALENVNELRRMGAGIALDDFGTGLASFEYLKLFKPDWIKIDGSFVREALLNPLGAEVVASMVKVARAANCKVVAEQVEDQATIDFMIKLGVHFVQGYAVSKPQPLDDLIEALREQANRDEAGPNSSTEIVDLQTSDAPPARPSNVKHLPWVKETFGV